MATKTQPRPKTEKQLAKERERIAKERFRAARTAEREYTRALTQVGKQVGTIIDAYTKENPLGNYAEMDSMLQRYADLITPWARRVTNRMHAQVAQRDFRSWQHLASSIGKNITKELATAPTGPMFTKLMAEQVTLIRSLPLEAGQRVHELTRKALTESSRFDELVPEILNSGKITVSRARLIARTESARTRNNLTQVRAEHIGSEGYIWRTMEDKAVRTDHRLLNGKPFRWDAPPIADRRAGVRAHPGTIYNCRCFAQPILT